MGAGAATWPPDAHPWQPASISLSPAWLALTGHRHGSQASLDSHPLPSSSQLVCPWAHRTRFLIYKTGTLDQRGLL